MGDSEAKLDHFYNGLVGERYRLAGYETFTIRLTSPENYVATEPAALETLRASDFTVTNIARRHEADHDVIEVDYVRGALRVAVSYRTSRERKCIRKNARIRNDGAAVRLVSVALHDFKVCDGRKVELLDCGYRFSTPLYGSSRLPDEYVTRLGMPAILWGDGGGLLMGLQFPACHNELDAAGRFTSDYRPGVLLADGSEYVTEDAFYLPFAGCDKPSAQRAFADYVEETYPPRLPSLVRFNCAGTWLEQVNRERAVPIVPLAKEIGAQVFVIDFGGTHYERFPFSFGNANRLPPIEQVEQGIVRRELFPGGWDEFNLELKKNGLRLGLHYETQGFPHLEEMPQWRLKSPINEGYCLCTPYGELFSGLVLEQVKKYNLGEIKLDYFTTEPCSAAGHDHMANGYDSTDKQVLQHLELLRACREAVPDLVIALFVGGGYTSPWWARYADQLHSGDPGHQLMFKVMLEENAKSEAIAIERRERWHWATGQAMRPAYCVQMDVHGFGIQSTGKIASIMHPTKDDSVPAGAGWRQTLFSNIALTGARDIKLNPYYLTKDERAFVARWFDWARTKQRRLRRPRSILSAPNGHDLEGYAHADENGGYVFLFNPKPMAAVAQLDLDSVFGRGPWRTKILYPVDGMLAGGSRINLPIVAKDCLVLEIERGDVVSDEAPPVVHYRSIAGRLVRPHEPYRGADTAKILEGLRGRDVCVASMPTASLAERRLERRVLRLLDVASMGRASSTDGNARAGAIQANVLFAESAPSCSGTFQTKFETTYFTAPDGTLVDGAMLAANNIARPQTIWVKATTTEHLERALDAIEDGTLARFKAAAEMADAAAFQVKTEGGEAGPLGPLFGQAVRILSRFSQKEPFALADLVVGASAKMLVGPHAARGLAKPPSQCRGYLAIPPAGGAVEAKLRLSVPGGFHPVLDVGIGLSDQPNPRYGINLATWATSVRFRLDVIAPSSAPFMLLNEDVHPEIYPSGEVPEYESLVARGFRTGFMRRQLLDLSRWVGGHIELRFRIEAPSEFQALYTLPVWSVPRLLVAPV